MAEEIEGIDGTRLLSIIERLERIDEEIKASNEDKKDVIAEAKSAGFEPKYIRWLVAERKKDPHDRETEGTMRDIYARAAGLD